VKNFPVEWALPNYRGVTQDAIDYMKPLIQGSPVVLMDGGLPAFVKPYYKR